MSVMQSTTSTSATDTESEAEWAFVDQPFQLAENVTELCVQFDRAYQTPVDVARELRHDGYGRTTSRCLDDDCPGYLWVDAAGIVCDRCGLYVRKDETRSDRTFLGREDAWKTFFADRPRYRNGAKKCVGGMGDYEWVSNDELDPQERIGTMDPTEFYR